MGTEAHRGSGTCPSLPHSEGCVQATRSCLAWSGGLRRPSEGGGTDWRLEKWVTAGENRKKSREGRGKAAAFPHYSLRHSACVPASLPSARGGGPWGSEVSVPAECPRTNWEVPLACQKCKLQASPRPAEWTLTLTGDAHRSLKALLSKISVTSSVL